MRYVNIGLGSLVVAIGAWLAGNALSLSGAAGVLIAAAAFVWWSGRTITLICAWSTILLGMESFAWPITTMLQIRSGGGDPSDEDMGIILSASLMGLFSAVFWVAFSYGLFKRVVPVLVDRMAADPEVLAGVVRAVPGVRRVRRIRSRWTGSAPTVDVIVTVDAGLSTVEAHAIATAIETILQKRFAAEDVTVHIEPDA